MVVTVKWSKYQGPVRVETLYSKNGISPSILSSFSLTYALPSTLLLLSSQQTALFFYVPRTLNIRSCVHYRAHTMDRKVCTS